MQEMSHGQSPLPTLTFVWSQFAPYHNDRCEAVAASLGDRYQVIGIEITNRSGMYAWAPSAEGHAFERVTLMPGEVLEKTSWPRRLSRLIAQLGRNAAGPVFLCNYEQPEILLTALWLRLRGRRVFIMSDSKFDDRRRHILRELFKVVLYAPYSGAFASGARTRDYLRLLGFPERRIALGYDTLSLARVRGLAGTPPAPQGEPFASRHFTVISRFLARKNLSLAIAAYDVYRRAAGSAARDLVLVGAGPLEPELRADVARRGLDGVRFAGFLQEEGIARALASSLALIVPSISDEWGLVVNEALAMGVPPIVAENVGARDDLVRQNVNGYVIEPDNVDGLARIMADVARDEAEWRRLCDASSAFAERGDVVRFAQGVAQLIGAERGA
ncbi:MAG TPA: glycosyltransferase [Alphaproteobacteria bacterium]|jgi:glycosyltransferase involved in cell wall biosynthesis